MVPLFIPSPENQEAFGRTRETTAADGALLRFSVRSQERDEQERTQRSVLRYERHADGRSEVVDRTWTVHWHTQDGFRALAAGAGLAVAAVVDARGRPADPDAQQFTAVLTAAG